MKFINLILCRIEEIIVAVTLALAAILTFIEVLLRYGFNSSLGFTHELVVFLLIVSGLIGSSIGVRKKVHLGVEILIEQFSPRTQKIIMVGSNLFNFLFCFIIAWLGIEQVKILSAFGQVTPEMGIPNYIPMLVIPISFGLMSLRYVQEVIILVKTPVEDWLIKEEGETV